MENKIKVCHVTSVHDRYDTRVFYKECSSLAKAGYNVTLLVADGGLEETLYGVHIVSVAAKQTSRLKRILESSKAMLGKALEINAEIYHLHDPELLPLGVKLKNYGKKVIFDSHEDVAAQILKKEWLPEATRPIIAKAYDIYAKSAYKKFDALISVSPKLVERLLVINPNTFLVTNYPIIGKYSNYNRKQDREVRFGFAGGITEQWNHETILNALNGIAAKYILMGCGDSNYMERLRKMPSWAKTVYLGKIVHEDVVAQLYGCAAGLAVLDYSPNTDWKNGTLGNTKLFEYMDAGVPVICSDFILWKEIVDKWHCGICVKPRDAISLRDAMQYIANNPQIAEQMGENGRKAILQEFNWAIDEKILLNLYKNIFEQNK